VSEFVVHESANDLKAEADLPKLEPKESEPVRDLANDIWCAGFVTVPSDVFRGMERPSNWDATRPRESDKDLKRDDLSLKLEANPREPERDLTIDACSARLEAELTVTVSDL
jgi:hypothetical protein